MTAAMPPLAPLLMIASGSVHAIVNAIVKGGRDKMAGRALTDGSSAVILLPATLLVPLPAGAWGWIVASGVIHGFICGRWSGRIRSATSRRSIRCCAALRRCSPRW